MDTVAYFHPQVGKHIIGSMTKPAACSGCPYEGAPGPVWSDGDPLTAKFIVLAEVPAWDELRDGKGLVGRAGQEFWRLAGAVGIKRSDCYVCNVVKCVPLGAAEGKFKPDPRAAEHCRRAFLEKELEACLADTEIVLGGTALEARTGETEIMRFRGTELTQRR